jgi:hypothetical protein
MALDINGDGIISPMEWRIDWSLGKPIWDNGIYYHHDTDNKTVTTHGAFEYNVIKEFTELGFKHIQKEIP